ncbi:MAG: GGDEF domain-containing protein [Archangium sp.]|nr:GGDEF domain-containing protein [Archangium sp.]
MGFTFPPESALLQFTRDELEAIFKSGTEREFPIDEVIVTEGQPGDSMFFLLEGYVGARLDSGAMARSYGPGSYFGELSFINPGHLRSTTLVATTKAKVLIVDQSSVQTLLDSHPRVIFTLLRRACVFLMDAERNLISDLRRSNGHLRETIAKLDHARMRLSQEELTSRTDFLTGISNRRGFDAEIPTFVERAVALTRGLSLLSMDLDSFKTLNDQLGHPAGDVLLKGVGEVLSQGVRRSDLPARFGGDEFVVLLADLEEHEVKARAEVLRAAIARVQHPGVAKGIHVTATIGGTMFRPGETIESFMRRADEALYAAKRAGKDRLGWT